MYLGIGFVLSLAIAFDSPYFWDSTANPALYSSLTTSTAFAVLCGSGIVVDRYRKTKQPTA